VKVQNRRAALIVAFLSVQIAGKAQTPIPGKFYEYYVVARTGAGGFASLGNGPSINDAREVAFQGATSAGTGLWFGTGAAAAVNFNPGEVSTSDTAKPAVQINANHQVVSLDSLANLSGTFTNLRLYNANGFDSFVYATRGGPSRGYAAIFAGPGTNINGDVVYTAQTTSQSGTVKTLGYIAAGSSTPVEQSIRASLPMPLIADDGTVVVATGVPGQTNIQIQVYPSGLGSPFVIADTNGNWTALDTAPGISRDGRVVAFQGNPNAVEAAAIGTTIGPGIFVAVNEGAGFGSARILRVTGSEVEDVAADRAAKKGNYDGVCDLGEICKPAAELGFDASGSPITISSYGSGTRVGVVNVDFGAAGIDDDSFVVSFVATPSSASRNNPMLAPGTPLLFSSQQGLWTIRVDVQHQLSGTLSRVYHPFTPIPVVQIGDRLGPDTVTGVGVYDPIANAAHDESGNIRTMRRGDHRVAFWASTNNGQVVIRANHLDSDQDGLLDHWENSGIDMDQDGVVDLKLSDFGADPFTRDIFLQVDWVGMPGDDRFKPAGAVFPSDVANTYSIFEANLRSAEALTGALYGARIDGSPAADIKAGVVPHVDAGRAVDSLLLPMSINLGAGSPQGGNYIGMPGNANALPQVVYFGQPGELVSGVNVRAFQDIKDTYLGAADKDARLLAFHYVVFAPFQDFMPNYPATPYSATIAGGDTSSVLLNQPVAAFPQLRNGNFMVVTSGAAQQVVRQIGTIATDGATGNARITLGAALNPAPDLGDGVAFFDGSTGLAEVAFAPDPDFNSLPGNDNIVSTGAMGVAQGVPPNQCMEGETASHELGHTLGLRHGGTDHTSDKPGNNYVSVMSYTWQLVCTPVPQVPNYSKAGDPTFDDYAHMQFNFSDIQFHLSTSLGEARGEGFPDDLQQQTPEQTLLDFIAKNGPLDTVPPTVNISSPAANANVSSGGTLTVNVAASDNVAISRVSVSFDINGNGAVDTGDAIAATQTGAGTWQATFANVSTTGTRPVAAIAWDTYSNATRTAINVNVVTPGADPCDINNDGGPTVADLQQVIREALGLSAAVHDVNHDGVVNGADLQILVNANLQSGCAAH
jgi:hypothetical protein